LSELKYYLIAGEASGDLHGSKLIAALKDKDPKAQIRFWGGDRMQQAGGTLVKHFKTLAFMGFWEVLIHLRTILNNIHFCKKDITAFQPDVIIYIDYPGFNIRIAQWAKKQGFKNHYYISPQVWAWKESRVQQMKKNLDALYVILPFEKEFFEKKHHFKVSFVGHPLLDTLTPKKKTHGFVEQNQLSSKRELIALLPGSRKQEIKKMLPVFLEIALRFPQYQFVIAGAPNLESQWYERFIKDHPVRLIQNKTHDLLLHAKAALVSSGTATLETALLNVPQVVCYRSSFISYQIAKRLVKLKYISLVNLILDRAVVKELIQNDFTPDRLTQQLEYILSPTGAKKIKADYKVLRNTLGRGGASDKTAQHIIDALQ
jgi:lipid-A-disaccharide synthase